MVPAKLSGIVGIIKLGANSLAPGKAVNGKGCQWERLSIPLVKTRGSKGQAIHRSASGSKRLINFYIFWGAQF
jgi:hypothetical protein